MKIRNRLIAGAASVALATAGVVALGALPASATSDGEVCTPSAAWTEIVEVPAVGEPTITVTNPDYKPAIPAVTKIVTHPAETKNVQHAAEGYTEYHFAKFTRERTRTLGWSGWGNWSDYGGWTKYSPETHTSWQTSTNAIGSPEFHSSGQNGYTQWERQWQAQYDGQSRFHETKAAWVEVVVTKPAWDETVVVTPEVPAVGTETIQVSNPDYKPASSYPVDHPAVVCPAPPAPNANGEATCGEWSITLYNVEAEGYENKTASYVVYIDGKFDAAYAVPGGETEVIEGTFPEDSGNHQVIVRTGPAQGDEFVFSLDVTSDCETTVPPTEEPPTEEPPVTTPETPVVEKPVVAKVVAKSVPVDTLAQTGAESNPMFWALGALAVAAGAASMIFAGARRSTIRNSQE